MSNVLALVGEGAMAHYEVHAGKPDPKSYFAFQLAGQQIFDAEPHAPLWLDPVALDDSMPTDAQAYWRRWNPILNAVAECRRAAALTRLKEIGANTAEPLAPPVAALVSDLVAAERMALMRLDDRHAPRQAPSVKTRLRVVAGACDTIRLGHPGLSPNAVHTNAAAFLRGSARWKLTRDHVRRAEQRYRDVLLRLCRSAPPGLVDIILRGECQRLIGVFGALHLVYRWSRSHPGFRHLEGEGLALAIHHGHRVDLNECIHRALAASDKHAA